MVAEPAANPVTVKGAIVLPPGIMRLGASTSIIPLGLVSSANARPPLGACAFIVIKPLMVRPMPTLVESSSILMLGATTFTVAVPEVKPGAETVIVALLVVFPPVTSALAPVAFWGIATVDGTVATFVSLLSRFTIWPPGPAGAGSATVTTPVPFIPTFRGLGVSVMAVEAGAVISTVAGLLLVTLSLAINCARYVPATSATKVGDELWAASRVAELLAGRLVNAHPYDSAS
jgi:hypothetical protein